MAKKLDSTTKRKEVKDYENFIKQSCVTLQFIKKETNATKDWKSQKPFLSVSDHPLQITFRPIEY